MNLRGKGRRRFSLGRRQQGCLHVALVAAGDDLGLCIECNEHVATPFTIRGHTSGPAAWEL